MTITLKSPISHIGGKYFLRRWLTSMMPEHVCYVEIFAGAGHLLFAKSPCKVEVLNDIDGSLIGFFQVVKDPEKRRKLLETLQYMPYSRSLWNELRSQWKAGNIPGDEVERVSWWFFLNRTCFGGDQKRGGFACPSVTGRNPVQSFRNSVETFAAVAEKLRNVCIENLDYADCIRRYDSPCSLIYADPPYLNADKYYGDSFSLEDHYRLSEILHSVESKVMVSHYENDTYNLLYQGWNKHTYESFKGSHKSEGEEKPKTVECLWTNFEVRKTQKALFPEVNL
ncbi:MAG: DNA adenine methylase [Planctomycetes bacterium]|nr:DNA adenine methylase [Planctomycetota bacterium]